MIDGRFEPPQAVLFDAVGTLIHPDPPVARAYSIAGRRFGSFLNESEILARFADAFARQEALDQADSGDRTNEVREHARWRAIVAEVFDDVRDADGLFELLWDHFADPKHWRMYDDAARAWGALAARGMALGIASNFDARLECVLRGLWPRAAAGRVFISSEIRWRKPSENFFASIAESLSIAPPRLLLVGDDVTNDYHGARAAGWRAVLLDRRARGAECDVESVPSSARIASLDELVNRLIQ